MRSRGRRTCPGSSSEIPALIRAVREEKGLTQYQLADRLQATQSMVARWERGGQDLKVGTLSRIADALGVELVIRFGSKGATR